MESNWNSEAVRSLVSELATVIDKYDDLKKMNFGIFYQNGRIGFMDLDAFAETTKVKLDADGEEKSLTEVKERLNKEEK